MKSRELLHGSAPCRRNVNRAGFAPGFPSTNLLQFGGEFCQSGHCWQLFAASFLRTGELSPAARAVGRAKEPKYKGLGGGAVGNWRPVHRCISSPKTYPKFTDKQSNLLIISDDLFLKLFYSLFQVEGAL